MNFSQAETYLLSLGNEVEAMKLGLESIRKLLAALGDPQDKYYKVQVAGTNGKGSVCAFLDSICGEAAIKRGLFTSPHLVSMTERVKINGNDISEAEFARFATAVRGTAEQMVVSGELEYTPTFFEQLTAIALLSFADAGVEIAILETGLGGRLDATTAAGAAIAAITRIDLDHQEYLGQTIELIAAEKAAIISSGTEAVVVGEQSPEAMRVTVEACERQGITPIIASDLEVPELKISLRGRHQVENAQVAMALAKVLQSRFAISDANIVRGLNTARHPGRLEFVGRYLFDGAHNIGGAKALRRFLDESVDRPVTLIFGAMKGKDVTAFAELMFPKADSVILTRVDSPRSMTADEIADVTVGKHQVMLTASVSEALERANKLVASDGVVLVTGSLYLVGEVKKLLGAEI